VLVFNSSMKMNTDEYDVYHTIVHDQFSHRVLIFFTSIRLAFPCDGPFILFGCKCFLSLPEFEFKF